MPAIQESARPARPPRKAILLVDHGSILREANAALGEVARLVAREAPEFHVECCHMEIAEPSIEQGFAACAAAGAVDVTVHPYMLAPGRHATQDIPRLVEEAARRHPGIAFRVSEPLGVHKLIANVVLERVVEARRADVGANKDDEKQEEKA